MKQELNMNSQIDSGLNAKNQFQDVLSLSKASAVIEHRAVDGTLLDTQQTYNLITNAGRVQYHKQIFDTTGLATNGNNYIALSNDALTETVASTSLSAEISSNGLSRAQGAVTLPTGSGTQTIIQKVFTASGAQAAQKCALFNAASNGVMNHVLAFTQRSLQTGDTLTITITIQLS